MSYDPFSSKHLDYFQRNGRSPPLLSTSIPTTGPLSEMRRLWRIDGVGLTEKVPSANEKLVRLPSENLIVGLYGCRVPLAFLVVGTRMGVQFHLGTWIEKTSKANSEDLDLQQKLLKTGLSGLYPRVDLVPIVPDVSRLPFSGFALGIPTIKPPDPLDNSLPVDRLIRAMSGTSWAVLILAYPLEESVTISLRDCVANEMRLVQGAHQVMNAPTPLAQLYLTLLKAALESFTLGIGDGMWRTGVYLLGNKESYSQLASVWGSIFSGEKSLPEPIRVWACSSVSEFAQNWMMPDIEGAKGPGFYQHAFECQTLLNSSQLAAYVHLPQSETSGFAVTAIPTFDAVPPSVKDEKVVHLGKILHLTDVTEKDYDVSFPKLTRHTFVAGVTGAGKTNTIFYLLKQASALGIPFLVIEPAKTEYRSLLKNSSIAKSLQIFTVGNENVSPLRLNPFEVPKGTSVALHIDLLRSIFSVSFGMWTPLPQVLEQCLYGIYADRGWDIAMGVNYRLGESSDVTMAYPTLTDLVDKVNEIVPKLGYEARVEADIHAALHTRLNSLRTGGKGRMLDTRRSLSMEAIFQKPTIMELESMGDDDDKAFMMGLLFIRIVEHLRALGESRELRHILVIEEAHRLLSSVQKRSREEEADPRSKAVETFAHLLAEIRAYGQGVVIADQIPVKLISDVIKNTGLKIAHRIVDLEDRQMLAGAMAMTEKQSDSLTILNVGQAAMFADGDDAPLLIQVPRIEEKNEEVSSDNLQVAEHMKPIQQTFKTDKMTEQIYTGKDAKDSAAFTAAEILADEQTFKRDARRLILAAYEDDSALDRYMPHIQAHVNAISKIAFETDSMLRFLLEKAASWYAYRYGAKAGWSYSDCNDLKEKTKHLLLSYIDHKDTKLTFADFRDCVYRINTRPFPPYSDCEKICNQKPQVCLYRYPVADLIATENLTSTWISAIKSDQEKGERYCQTWEACLDAAQILVGHLAPSEVIRRVGLCYAQQMLYPNINWLPDVRMHFMKKLQLVADDWQTKYRIH